MFKWNIIKHEKFLFTEELTKIYALEAEDQYSLHHDFSKCTADSERDAVEKMFSYINERGNPVTRNIVSGGKLDDELVAFKAYCLIVGEDEYQKFKDERFKDGRWEKMKMKDWRRRLYNYLILLTLFRMGLFGAVHGWEEPKRPPSLKSVAHILQG